ncbi:hypothetical protein Airi01_073760 [Actinoallomurus iriomotensis]|uniref:Uncharacterized protein n=1 Tax=Actinoallomurus iriomotensis TaxID=478107 RepID=A0A9W6RP93_9ACTN|nr:hypothetical protein Airi01_073760 [Actinoallomurus iriomotensis]
MSTGRDTLAPTRLLMPCGTYGWATSAPARLPVLVTVAVTVEPPDPSAPTWRSPKENAVYDRPYPKGNSGVMFCASYQAEQ